MIKDLVSIIVPCYNGDRYIKGLFESIANQTYKNIELIFINDVSNDNTDDCVKNYRYLLDNENIVLKYEILSEKGYAAGAVNKGLKLMEGEYFMLLDCDDYIYPDNIMKKVDFLRKNQDYAWVMSQARIVNGLDHSKVERIYVRIKNLKTQTFFKDLIWGKNVFYTPGIYMYRTEEYLKINPERKIYISKGGQNYQMLLPMAAKYKIGYIKEILFDWYEYPDSHSHDISSYEEHIQKINGYNENICETIKYIKDKNDKILKIANEKHNYMRMAIALHYQKYDDYDKIFDELKRNKNITVKIRVLDLTYKNLFVKYLSTIKEKVKAVVLKCIKRKNQ